MSSPLTSLWFKEWATKFTQVSLILLGAGPPCQGVSALNASRKGALRDERSCFFTHVARVRELLKQCFPLAQVRSLMENVASMSSEDEQHMSDSFGTSPLFIDAAGVSIAHRPRLYWVDWGIKAFPGCEFGTTPAGRNSVMLTADLNPQDFLQNSWRMEDGAKLSAPSLPADHEVLRVINPQESKHVQLRKRIGGSKTNTAFHRINISPNIC